MLQINSIIVVSYNSIQFNSIYINIFILITNYPSIHPDPSTHPSIPIHPSIHLQCTHPSSHPPDRVWFFRFFYQFFMQAIWFQFCLHRSIVCIESKEKHWWFYVTTPPPPFSDFRWVYVDKSCQILKTQTLVNMQDRVIDIWKYPF